MSLHEIIEELNREFINREDVIEGLIIGLLTGQNLLLLGPPGTGKTMLVNALVQKISGINYFAYLMTKFTRPDEILGPISLRAMEEDKLERVLTGRLADAQVAFLDEVFNSNSSCLNAILTIMNEKCIINGTEPTEVPLMMLVGASNTLPDEVNGELMAFYDRFLLRYSVDYLQCADVLQQMLRLSVPQKTEAPIGLSDLRRYQEELNQVFLPDSVVAQLIALVLALRRQDIVITDRRVQQSCQVLKAKALLAGRKTVLDSDLQVLRHVFWNNPDDEKIFLQLLAEEAYIIDKRVHAVLSQVRDLTRQAFRDKGFGAGQKAGGRLVELKKELEDYLALLSFDQPGAERVSQAIDTVDEAIDRLLDKMLVKSGAAGE